MLLQKRAFPTITKNQDFKNGKYHNWKQDTHQCCTPALPCIVSSIFYILYAYANRLKTEELRSCIVSQTFETVMSKEKKFFKKNDYFGYDNVLIKEIKGIKIAFVGYTTVGLWPTSTNEMTKMIKSLNYFCKISVFGLLIGMVIGVVLGFFLARKFMKKYLKENPPINEKMIKIMMQQMGRTPSQKQVNQMMKSMSKYM